MAQVPSNLIPTRVSQLPNAPVASEDGLLLFIYEGVSYKIRAGDLLSVAGVPTNRQVIAGTGLTGGGQLVNNITLSIAPGGVGTAELASTGVTPGTYGDATKVPVFTVDSTGRLMSAGTVDIQVSGTGTVTSVDVSGGLTGLDATGGPITDNGTITLSGVLNLTSGGTGATTAIDALANLGGYPLTNPAGYTTNTGTVTSVSGTGSVNGISLSGTVTSSGNLTLGGALIVSPADFGSQTGNTVLAGPNGAGGNPTFRALVAADVPTLNQNTTGTASNVTGVVAIANGGTNATTAATALTNLGAYPASNPSGYTSNTGTVTSVAALTLGTTGTDLSSTVATGTTTPVITLNVPTASATNRGVLSSADWTTFNSKGAGTVTAVTGTSPVVSSGGTTPAISIPAATTSVNGYLTSTDWNTFNNKQSAFGSQTAKFFYAAPNGSSGVPTFRGIVAADVPTLNQNTTGTAANVTGVVAIANGGTNATTAATALSNLGAYPASNPAGYTTNTGTVTSVSGTGTVSGITLSGTVTSSGSLTLGGSLDLSSPPAIGGTTANLINGTTITGTKFVGISGGTF